MKENGWMKNTFCGHLKTKKMTKTTTEKNSTTTEGDCGPTAPVIILPYASQSRHTRYRWYYIFYLNRRREPLNSHMQIYEPDQKLTEPIVVLRHFHRTMDDGRWLKRELSTQYSNWNKVLPILCVYRALKTANARTHTHIRNKRTPATIGQMSERVGCVRGSRDCRRCVEDMLKSLFT